MEALSMLWSVVSAFATAVGFIVIIVALTLAAIIKYTNREISP